MAIYESLNSQRVRLDEISEFNNIIPPLDWTQAADAVLGVLTANLSQNVLEDGVASLYSCDCECPRHTLAAASAFNAMIRAIRDGK